MEIRRSRLAGSIRTEGGLLPSDLLEKIRAADPDVPGLKDADFGLPTGERAREGTTRSWNRLVGSWAALEAVRVGAEVNDPLVGPTRDRFLVPLFEELGFGRLPVARVVEIEGTSYPISHNSEGRVPVHLVGHGVELDSRTKGVRGAAGAAPHALVQEYLNRADDALWGIVSNGRTLRLLRDSTSLTRQAYVEFDLEAIFEGELYADFALLWSVLHRSRFDGERPADCLLERWTKKAADDGTRALDKLRGGVEKAIETLGVGFLATKGNAALLDALRHGELEAQDYYRELLRLVYRLIFLFTAEDRRDEETGRELLLDPKAPEAAADRYRRYYSTVRLRSFAGRRRGSRHPDLWLSLRRVVAALGADGAPSLALPALGSFLFGNTACPHLDASVLTNADLLDAVRALATIEEDRRLRLVDYRNLGAEELGGIYEGLLELHPRIELDAIPPRFSLGTAAGNERKSSGSYYTPTSLINCLLDSALDPVVDEAVYGKSSPDAEAAILGLSVVDPAAGSGHFVIAAAHRLAKRLASVRSGEGEPPPAQVRHALRDVISHCIYAVDLNPMAVELCKVSLWLEALEPGRPLSFLDAHVKCGNSILGTTPNLAAGGVPDAAYEAISGDDKVVARDWRRINAGERAGQYSLFGPGLADPVGQLAVEARALEVLPEDSPASVSEKAARHEAYLASAAHIRVKAALDAWCSAFVVPKVHGAPAITTATVRLVSTGGASYAATRDLVERTASEYGFFHWPLEFPAVFERGGFAVVLGNPPWERIKLAEQEFFAERGPAIASARNAAERKRMIARLPTTDPVLWSEYRAALRRSEGDGQLLRSSGQFSLTARGDVNLYAVFAELMRSVVEPRGRMGIIVPTGIATDDSTKFFFGELVSTGTLASLYDFENRNAIFAGVHRSYKFCLLTTTGTTRQASRADLVFFAHSTQDLANQARHFQLSSDEYALLNPATGTCPQFLTRRDAELNLAIYRRCPVLGSGGSATWQLRVMQGLYHQTNDVALLRSEEELAVSGASIVSAGAWAVEGGARFHRVFEGRQLGPYDHRAASAVLRDRPGLRTGASVELTVAQKRDPNVWSRSRFYVRAETTRERLPEGFTSGWHVAFKDVTSATNERTMIAAVLPTEGVLYSIRAIYPDPAQAVDCFVLVANLNAFMFDYLVRQKTAGNHITDYIFRQLPVLPPTSYGDSDDWMAGATRAEWLRRRLVELVFTSNDLVDFARDLGWDGGPFSWAEDRRVAISAEVDAGYFHFYDVGRDDVVHILDSFPIVRRRDEAAFGHFKTRDDILEAYDAMAAATSDRPFMSRLDPPPGDPRAARPLNPGGKSGRWVPWSEVLARTRNAATAARSVATAVASPARPRPAIPARAVPEPPPSLFAMDPASAWQPEAAVAPSEIMLGARVRHRAKGEGTLLSVRPSGKGTELLIRFDATGEAWIAFGYGVLEFQVPLKPEGVTSR